MKNSENNVICYKKYLADLKAELEDFEALLIDRADPNKPLAMAEIMEHLDIIEQAYYEHLTCKIAQLERWVAVEEGREKVNGLRRIGLDMGWGGN